MSDVRVEQPRTYLGEGALREFAALLDELGVQSIFLVADAVSFAASGAEELMQPGLATRSVSVFEGFRPNPRLADVERGVARYRSSPPPDLVVAVGGGSAIDMAKLVRWFASHEGQAPEVLTSSRPTRNQLPVPPLMAIPTTAGTGSEATQFAVVYYENRKHSVSHPTLVPEIAVVDSTLTSSQPPALTAATGLDALCQAIESIWSVRATAQSLEFASESLSLAVEHLQVAVKHPNSRARQAMARAAHLSGQAINISLTTACHALSYTLTSCFGVPHGIAVALTLPSILEFNYGIGQVDCLDPRGPTAVRERIDRIVSILECPDVGTASERLRRLMADINCPIRLGQVGVRTSQDLRTLVESVNLERLANNPRQLARHDILCLLESIR